jgi:hypothetical protein
MLIDNLFLKYTSTSPVIKMCVSVIRIVKYCCARWGYLNLVPKKEEYCMQMRTAFPQYHLCMDYISFRRDIYFLRSDVFRAVKMLMLAFSVVTPRGHVGRYQPFEGTYCLHLQGCLKSTWRYNPQDLCGRISYVRRNEYGGFGLVAEWRMLIRYVLSTRKRLIISLYYCIQHGNTRNTIATGSS